MFKNYSEKVQGMRSPDDLKPLLLLSVTVESLTLPSKQNWIATNTSGKPYFFCSNGPNKTAKQCAGASEKSYISLGEFL